MVRCCFVRSDRTRCEQVALKNSLKCGLDPVLHKVGVQVDVQVYFCKMHMKLLKSKHVRVAFQTKVLSGVYSQT